MRFRLRTRLFLVALAALAPWIALQVFGPYSTLRNRAKYVVGTDRLQAWAISVLENPPPLTKDGPEGCIDPAALPADIARLARGGFVVLETGRVPAEEHVLFAVGGGFYHYGLRVGRPAYRPGDDGQFVFEKLADGVYGMYED